MSIAVYTAIHIYVIIYGYGVNAETARGYYEMVRASIVHEIPRVVETGTGPLCSHRDMPVVAQEKASPASDLPVIFDGKA
jgi:hypothetical protein